MPYCFFVFCFLCMEISWSSSQRAVSDSSREGVVLHWGHRTRGEF